MLTIETRLSRDDRFQASDPLLSSRQVQLSGAPEQTFSIPATVPTVPPGLYRTIVRLDPASAIVQYSTTNDLGVSQRGSAVGPDLAPSVVAGPAAAVRGAQASFSLTVENRGAPFTGRVDVALKLSPDALNDVNDPVIATTTVDLAGAVSESFTVQATVPTSLSRALYFPIVSIDPADRIDEVSEGNNIVVARTPVRVGPDFEVSDIVGPTRGLPADSVQVTTDLGSIGAPFTGPVDYTLYLSEDDQLDPTDPAVGTFTVNITGAGVSDTRSVVLPGSAVGDRRFIAVVDPAGRVQEADEGNNGFVDATVARFGTDLGVFSISYTPTEVDPDGTFDLSATLFVGTNGLTASIEYQVFLSSNLTLEPRDPLVGSGAQAIDGLGSFGLSATIDLADATQAISPGEYDVFVVVDPNDQIPERREDNNAAIAFGTLVVRAPNLAAAGLISPTEGFTGRSYPVQVAIRNIGDLDAGPFEYGYYVARSGPLEEGVRVGGGTISGLPVGGVVNLNETVVLTSTLALGPSVFGIIVDSGNAVEEVNERDNFLIRDDPLQIRAPLADITGELVRSSTAAAPGESVSTVVVVSNFGFVDANDVDFAYVLVPPEGQPEVELGRRTVSLPADGLVRQLDVLQIPPTTRPSSRPYRLDVVLDPDERVAEFNEANNRVIGPPVRITSADLSVATAVLPQARVGRPYDTQLQAGGGTFARSWRVKSGALPDGLTLSSDGRITGTPTEEGVSSLVVEVTSGDRTADRAFDLVVRIGDLALAIVDTPVPPGVLGLPYAARFVAAGGAPPLVWQAEGLPDGLAMDTFGAVTGTPVVAGAFALQVTVRDGSGDFAILRSSMRVVEPDRAVRIDPTPLPPGTQGAEYCLPESVRLLAVGGFAPYVWSSTDLPVGMTLTEAGELCGTPTEVGRFPIVLTVVDAVGQVDTASAVISVVSNDLVVVRTVVLPAAGVSTPYAATLSAGGGTPPYNWSAEYGQLPPGLQLRPDGEIFGVCETPGVYPFAVEATDARGSSAVRPLSIEVLGPPPTVESVGCRCAPRGRPGRGLGILMLGLLIFVRRWRLGGTWRR